MLNTSIRSTVSHSWYVLLRLQAKEYEIQFVSEDDDKLNEIHNASIDNGQKKKTKS